MKGPVLVRNNLLWLLLLLLSLGEARPQGYHYPAPANIGVTTSTTSTTPSGEEVTSVKEETTSVSLSDYLVDGKDESSGPYARLESTTPQEGSTEIPIAPETSSTSEVSSTTEEPVTSSDAATNNEKEGEKEIEEVTEKENEAENEAAGNEGKTEKVEGSEDNSSTSTEVPLSDDQEIKLSEGYPKSTPTSDNADTKASLSAPYPPSGQRPPGPQFSYEAPGPISGASSTSPSASSPNPNEPTAPFITTPSRVANPLQEEPPVPNNAQSAAQLALTSPASEQPYFYQPPPQQVQNNFYGQQSYASRSYPTQGFTQSYSSGSYHGAEPYPPSEPVYDQRFSSSNVVPQKFLHPAGYEYLEEPRYEFSYDVRGPYHGPLFGHRESRRGDEAQGVYYVVQPDGRRRVVRYEAGPGGYRPRISYEPMANYQEYK